MIKKFKASDIHPEGIGEEFDRLMLLDVADLLDHKATFVQSGCPACHGVQVGHVFDHQSLAYCRCSNCETLFISPAPSEAQHLQFLRTSRAMAFWRECLPESMKIGRRPMYLDRLAYAQRAWEKFGTVPGDVLELGAGNGEFAEQLLGDDRIRNVVLLDAQALKLNHPKVEIITDGFEALEKTQRKFDTVFAWEMIEHVLEPDNFLRVIGSVLKPGAPLILSTPNERSIETRKLGVNSSNILFDHVRLYNPKSIRILLERNGFRVIEVVTPGQLDVDRLHKYLKTNPDSFVDDPALSLLLKDEEASYAFQVFLQQNLLSSHMRVIAVFEGPWRGGMSPRLS